MAKNPESPLEPFKRALAHAARSLAETPDLEIVYSGEGPQLSGNRAVLPHPPRDPPPARPLVDLFRAEVEKKAGADLDRLAAALDDQKTYARITRAIIHDLDM